jgi:hypothetical protein
MLPHSAARADTVLVNEPFTIGTSQTAPLPNAGPSGPIWRADKLTTVRTVGSFGAAVGATDQRAGDNMSSTAANGIYNYADGAATTSTERAVGFISSGTATMSGNLYVNFDSGVDALDSLTISYGVEKYRNGTNAAGFRIQMFYSLDGSAWTSAGGSFLTAFAGGDANNNGFPDAPGATVPVTNTLLLPITANTPFYLAWNYSVTTGTTTTNAQALGIDDVVITGQPSPAAVPLPPAAVAGTVLLGIIGAFRKFAVIAHA